MIINGPCFHCSGSGCWRCHDSGQALRYVEDDLGNQRQIAPIEQQELAQAWYAMHPHHWLTRLAHWWDNRSTWLHR